MLDLRSLWLVIEVYNGKKGWQKILLDIKMQHKNLPCSCSEEGGTGTVSVYTEVGVSGFSDTKFILLLKRRNSSITLFEDLFDTQ